MVHTEGLNGYRDSTIHMCEHKGWTKSTIEQVWLLLTEEIGELASAIRRATNQFSDRKKVNVEGEIMDVLSYLLQIADKFDIDLDAEWQKRIKRDA